MGVITICDIDYGRIFGPFPVQVALMDPTYVIGMLTQDTRHDSPAIEVDPDANVGVARADGWLAYIQPAREEEEQNVEAYMKNGQVFYRTLRIIKAGEELLVWYSKDFCQLIGIPDVRRSTIQEKVNYVCQFCGEKFQYLFPLRAHMRFKCDNKRKDNRSIYERIQNQEIKSDTKSLCRVSNSDRLSSDICRLGFDQTNEDILVGRKRPAMENNDHIEIKVKSYENGENQSPPLRNKKSPEKDYNANISIDVKESNTSNPSAFRKVERSLSPQNTVSSSSLINASNCEIRRNANLHNSTDSRTVSSSKDFVMPTSLATSSLPTSPLMGSSSLPANVLDPQLRASMMEAYRFAFPQQYNGTQESMMRSLHGIGVDPSKQYGFADKINTDIPYIKSTNPMVERILHNPNTPAMLPSASMVPSPAMPSPTGNAMPVFQNWCAKCNASFRMTSDLVYHMRSHHKREFDPVKKKRDDKLKCNICHETFRERHHLTRHMTSHA
ncbi:PR domain zinc finger protein 10-like [Ylistrum balloti]|uniref:PR domain zinc finger protein 10-like n=1 Tax=Ylistrum balloti TaxID=509963 RepID=UPI002905CFF7|nr:PR domain zinc finger protein 10-like [Ylistrum balloti]